MADSPIPPWWAPSFAQRQRRLRTLILRHLRAGGDLWQTTQQLHRRSAGFDARELVHALGTLRAEGLAESRAAREPISAASPHGRLVDRVYWRATPAEPGEEVSHG